MDCLICYKIFIKEAEYQNSPLPDSQICANSMVKLLEIPDSSKIQKIFKDPSLCKSCNERLGEANDSFVKMEEIQKNLDQNKFEVRKELAHSMEVSEVMWKNMPDRMSKSSLHRLRLFKEIGRSNIMEPKYTWDSKDAQKNDTEICEYQDALLDSPKKELSDETFLDEVIRSVIIASASESLERSEEGDYYDGRGLPELKICLERLQIPAGVFSFILKNPKSIDDLHDGVLPEKMAWGISKNKGIIKFRRIKCPHCFKGFVNSNDLNSHLLDEKPQECGICGESLKSQGCLKNHAYMVHGLSSQGDTELKLKAIHKHRRFLKCSQCNLNYISKKNLRVHLLTHGPPNFKCPINGCEKRFTVKDYLRKHIALVHEKSYSKCKFPGCGKKFISKINLNSHEKIHDNLD